MIESQPDLTPPIPEEASMTGPALEMAHVLFMDIVAYSKLPMDQQCARLAKLQEAVRNTAAFARALRKDMLICLPTGDGMALAFFGDPEAPVRCAVELSQALRQHPEIKLRMGIHTGPVYRVPDINAASNVAGGGINVAQRVMDCGDAGHILVSGTAAELLRQTGNWSTNLHDLGEVKVKHDQKLRLSNLYGEGFGNPDTPTKVREHIPSKAKEVTSARLKESSLRNEKAPASSVSDPLINRTVSH